jgi:viologen exporter family transport system permease protein
MSAQVVLRQESWARSTLDYYATTIRTQLQSQFQYRAAVYAYMAALVAEPVIYLVVWTTIAKSQGGTVQGIGVGQFAAYYVIWTLVRGWNVVFTPFGWEWRIRDGEFSAALLRPQHPIHFELAWWAGQKIVWLFFYAPVFVALVLVFHPALHPDAVQIVVFFFALWAAYVIRTINNFILGMITIWTTRASAIFQLWFLSELLLSGRLLPLQLMPQWVQSLTSWFPFKWTFYFPIEVLAGDMSHMALLRGLCIQALWIAICLVVMRFAWRLAARHYTAVGN